MLATKVIAFGLLLCWLANTSASENAGQSTDKPGHTTYTTYTTTLAAERWLENWSWVDPAGNMPLSLKNLHLPTPGESVLSLGGESRLRTELRDTTDFGLSDHNSLETANLRLLLHSTLTIGNRVRLFMQIGSWDQVGRETPRLFDASALVLQRGFLDWKLGTTVSMRVGRQDLFQSSSRLLIPVDVFNAQLVHDAVTLHYRQGGQRGRAFIGKRFYADRGVFDTRDLGRAELAGAFIEGGLERLAGFDFGLYWLIEWSDIGLFPRRAGSERRQTMIVRQTWRNEPWALSGEFGVQHGTTNGQAIHAWAFASEFTRKFALPGAIALTLRVDGASGDHAATRTNESWATLHPIMAYLGRTGDYGATNAIGVFPEISFEPIRGLRASLGGEWVWRVSRHAAFADPGGRSVLPAFTKSSDLLLAGMAARIRWANDSALEIQGELTWLEARGALADIGGEQRLATSINVLVRF